MAKHFLCILFVLSLVGCDRTSLQVVETVPATSGTDRLIRKDWETVSRSNPDEKSYDPHSIVWQRLDKGSWQDHMTISQSDFQRGSANRRWISTIDSFDAKTGIAVLKIAEGDAPENSGAVSYIYSWRKWDITNNRELELIRICDDPFEAFD